MQIDKLKRNLIDIAIVGMVGCYGNVYVHDNYSLITYEIYQTVFWKNIGYIYIMDSGSDLEVLTPPEIIKKGGKNIDCQKMSNVLFALRIITLLPRQESTTLLIDMCMQNQYLLSIGVTLCRGKSRNQAALDENSI